MPVHSYYTIKHKLKDYELCCRVSHMWRNMYTGPNDLMLCDKPKDLAMTGNEAIISAQENIDRYQVCNKLHPKMRSCRVTRFAGTYILQVTHDL